jgi:hypothetical protein
MSPQLRAYLLVVGRDGAERPFRRVVKYHLPIPGLTDHYERMSNTALREVEQRIRAEHNRLGAVLKDIAVEKEDRLTNL